MTPVDDIVEFMRTHGDFEVFPWQREMLEHVLSGKPIHVMQPRSGGRANLDEMMKSAYRHFGYEIVERSGCWTAVLPAPVAD